MCLGNSIKFINPKFKFYTQNQKNMRITNHSRKLNLIDNSSMISLIIILPSPNPKNQIISLYIKITQTQINQT